MINLSIGIIGYNDQNNLELLLKSLENLNLPEKVLLEILYVDDGSSDSSCTIFNKHILNYDKNIIKNKKNLGRAFSRNQIIKYSKYNWILFLNSNIIIKNNDFLFNLLQDPLMGDAYMLNIKFTCSDKSFESYLNHDMRGLNNNKHLNKIHYKFLLFSACLVNKHFMIQHNISFNQNLYNYGGEELDIANCFFKNKAKIFYNKQAQCMRINHPTLNQHIKRLMEFGKTNLKKLSYQNQKDTIRYSLFLKKTIINKIIINSIFHFTKTLPIKSFFIIRLLWFSSIMKGYYKK